jgi:NAD(P)-dependent dehydrogenase (short-subunit alcohol dehydrogenase family)
MTRPPERQAGVADRDCSETTVLITGSTSGIGREMALALGRLGARVLVHGRDRERGERTVAALETTAGGGELLLADLAARSAVRELAAEVGERVETLDVLVNNAGGLFRDDTTSPDGVEYTAAVNHLAPFLLTHHLLAEMSDGGRVVTTSSGAHRTGSIDPDRFGEEADSSWQRYCRSKLANVLFTRELARRTDRVVANCFHPGFVPGSGFLRQVPAPVRVPMRAVRLLPGFGTSVEDGATTGVYLAVSPDAGEVSGGYFESCSRVRPSTDARDDDTARRLWERSEQLTGLEESLRLPRPA